MNKHKDHCGACDKYLTSDSRVVIYTNENGERRLRCWDCQLKHDSQPDKFACAHTFRAKVKEYFSTNQLYPLMILYLEIAISKNRLEWFNEFWNMAKLGDKLKQTIIKEAEQWQTSHSK